MNNEEKSLSELYKGKTTLGTIKLTDDGLDIAGKLVTNFNEDSLRVGRFGSKTIVTCELICDDFLSVPN